MENETEVAFFGGQVKTCGDNRVLSQWKSGMVKIYRREDGILNARMFLNVAPLRATSQITVVPADLNVKSNRVIVTDAKGFGFYVRLNGAKEVEESRNMINQLSSYECSKRSKAEVCSITPVSMKANGEVRQNASDSCRMKLSPSVNTPQRMNKYRGSPATPQVRTLSPVEASTYPLKRRSSELDEGYHDKNENFTGISDKKNNFTSVKAAGFKAPRMSKSTESESFRGLTSTSFYGKSKSAARIYGVKEPARQSSTASSRNQPLHAELDAMEAVGGSSQENGFSAQDPDGSCTEQDNIGGETSNSIVGFDNLGNTCFINSPLQCLSSLEPLSLDIQDVVLQYGHSLKKESVIRLLSLLMKYVRKHNLHGVKIKTILKVLRETLFGKFAINTQQDAHELLSEILDQVHEEIQDLKRTEERREEEEEDLLMACEEREQADLKEGKTDTDVSSSSSSSWSSSSISLKKNLRERLSSHILSPTEKNFTWFFKNSFHYHECKRQIWSQEERDTTLMLAFSSQMHLHLQDCVDDYFKSCDVEFKCESCDKNEAATITRKISKRPRCLILNLLRYQTDSLESKKKLDSVSIPRYISIADFCTEDVKDPLYINPVFMSDNKSTDDADESMLQFLLKTQEEMMKSESDYSKGQSSFSRAVGDPPQKSDTSDNEVKDRSNQLDVQVPGSSVNAGHKSTNSPGSKGEDSTSDVNVENSSSDSAKRKSPISLRQDREEAESDEITALDPLKKRKLEERLKCRGGSVEGSTTVINYIGEDAKALVEMVDESKWMYDKSNFSDGEPSFRDNSTSTKEFFGTKEDMDGETSTSAGYEASSEGDSTGSYKTESNGKFHGGNNLCNGKSVIVEKNVDNWQANSIMSQHAGSASRLSPIDEGHVSEFEDIDNKILCGRRLGTYSETELQALNVNLFNDNEMVLYVQAVSRFEYDKEVTTGCVAVRVANSALDDYGDCNSLDYGQSSFPGEASYSVCETSEERPQDFEMRTVASGLSNSGDSSCSRIRGIVSRKGKTGSSTSRDHAAISEADSVLLDNESSQLSPPAASTVPDIFETSPAASFREEAFFRDEIVIDYDDEKKKNIISSCIQGAAKVPSSPVDYDGHVFGDVNSSRFQRSPSSSSQRLEKCIFCAGPISAGQCSKCDSATGDFGCVPMDETFNVDDGNISEDVFAPEQFSSKSNILSDKGNKNKGMGSTSKVLKSHFQTLVGSSDIWASPSSSLSPSKVDRELQPTSSSSTFEKSKQDMYIASPSKTKNLVKTRDYSRLRNPITSPRKKVSKASPSKKSPAANKQLIFPESDKAWDKNLKSPSSPTLSGSVSERALPATTGSNTDTIKSEESESLSSVAMDSSSMMEQNDKSNESDSSYHSKQMTSFSNSLSDDKPLTKLEAIINTSTPICSTQETYSKNFQQPLHISVSPAPSSLQSKETTTKSTATSSVSPSSSQQKVQTVPTSCEAPPRSKASRSLSVSFAAAEEKENSAASNEQDQSRRKRLAHIESGDSDCSYRLVGVVNHHGESLFAGHYTSFSFNLHKQKWFYLDDKHTKETSETTVRRDSMCNGYVFFYMDKDLFDLYSCMKDASSSAKHSPP